MRHRVRSGLRALLLFLCACGGADADDRLPPVTPSVVPSPADNVSSAAKVSLGRHLFYDRRLSINETRACGTCHEQAKAFTDGFPRALGATRQVHRYNSPTLTNVLHRATLSWQDPTTIHLEQQLLAPLLGESPIEMGMGGQEQLLFERLSQNPMYPLLFEQAFGAADITLPKIAQALAAFERTIVSNDNDFDRMLRGEPQAMSAAAVRGMRLFFSRRAGCADCHGGTDLDRRDGADRPGFFNVGLYDVDGRGGYPKGAQGLIEITGAPSDMGRFRTPTLRNVALTAPYFHDGSVLDLRQAIQIHLDGGRNVTVGPRAGDGRNSPLRDVRLAPRALAASEVDDLDAFLRALTDERFVADPALASPWP